MVTGGQESYLERAMGIEPTAFCLGSQAPLTAHHDLEKNRGRAESGPFVLFLAAAILAAALVARLAFVALLAVALVTGLALVSQLARRVVGQCRRESGQRQQRNHDQRDELLLHPFSPPFRYVLEKLRAQPPQAGAATLTGSVCLWTGRVGLRVKRDRVLRGLDPVLLGGKRVGVAQQPRTDAVRARNARGVEPDPDDVAAVLVD